MKKLTYITTLLIVLLTVSEVFGQRPQRFRKNQPFLEELTRFFELGNNKVRSDTLLQKFGVAWENWGFTEDEKKYIFDAADKMLQAKTRPNPFPHFENYLVSLLLFKERKHDRDSWEKWHESLIYLFEEESLRKAEEFQEFTLLLLKENALYKSKSTVWTPSTSDYLFEYDDKDKYKAAVYFENIKLNCEAFMNDSLNIYNTSGRYYPISEEWRGKGGTVTWERAGIPNSIRAELKNYTIEMKHYFYKADTVEFHHSTYFSAPIAGSLEDRIVRPRMVKDSLGNESVDLDKVTYPRFTSFDKQVVIKNILTDIDFAGSFSMQGQKVYGRETSNAPAMLEFKRGGRVFARVTSTSFAMLADKITSVDAAVTFYLEKDSIFNTNMELAFDKKTKKLTISQPARTMIKSFFTDTYHALSFDSHMITWVTDDDKLYLRSLPTIAQNTVYFQSLNYFSRSRDKLISPDNRLFQIKRAIETNSGISSGVFTTEQVALEMKETPINVRKMLVELASTGLVEFNPYSNVGHAGPRFFEYIEMRAGRRDFDNIVITSELYRSAINGEIDLTNNSLRIYGVSKVPLSLRQAVDIRPADKTITVKKGLNFEFDGQVLSGALYAIDNDALFNLKKDPMVTPDIFARLDSLRNVYFGSENQFKESVKTKMAMEIPDEVVNIITNNAAKGLFRIVGRSFQFNYNEYKITLNKVDSATMSIGVSARAANGDTILVARPVRSTLEPKNTGKGYFEGVFFIDKSDNKSGKSFHVEFPKFKFVDPSYVFYDKRSEQHWNVADSAMRGIYPRNRFYYEIAPFELDSVNYMTINQRFPGKLVSAGIFPDIAFDLRIMEDFALGFLYKMPKVGLDMYGVKGTFFKELKLSNSGLESKEGELHFITSKIHSRDFVMYPDSTKTRTFAWNFTVDQSLKKPEFPTATGDTVYMVWYPYKDLMYLKTKKKPTEMYANKTYMEGLFALSSKRLTSDGRITYKNGSYVSQMFEFNANTIESDSATFSVRDNKGQLAFHTDKIKPPKRLKDYADTEEDTPTENSEKKRNKKKGDNVPDSLRLKRDTSEIPRFDHVKLKVDYTTYISEFRTRDSKVFVTFDKSTYNAFVHRFYWKMNDNLVEVGDAKEQTNEQVRKLELENKQLDEVLKSGYAHLYIRKQDSLNFYSGQTVLVVDSQLMISKTVPYIDIADISIYPTQPFYIEKTAKMRTLKEAKMVANRLTRFHSIFDASIDVYGRYNYAGTGKYVYIDDERKTQIINFHEITVNDSMRTIAKGKIPLEDAFTLNKGFEFKGNVDLYAPRQLLVFAGEARISHDCKRLGLDWFEFRSEINPDSVLLDVTLKDVKKADRRFAGSFISKDSIFVYSAFMLNKQRFNDAEIFAAVDTSDISKVYFDSKNQKYIVASPDKLRKYQNAGQYFSLDLQTCDVHAKGEMGFGMDFEFLKMKAVGDLNHQTISDTLKMNMMLGVDFMFNAEAVDFMGKMIMQSTDSTIDVTSDAYRENMIEMLGSSAVVDSLLAQLAMNGMFTTFPNELKYNLFFNDLKMVWSPKTQSFRSVGLIGIGNIGTKQINKYVNGYVNVMKNRTDDMIDIYLEANESTWFFFTYSRGIMSSLSSLNTFNDIIFDVKEKDRTKEENGKIYYYEKSSLPNRAASMRRYQGDEP